MVPRKEQNPTVPITPSEIVSQVLEIYDELGITSVHIHARREDQSPAWQRMYFEKIIQGIRNSALELALCVTTSGRDATESEKRSEVLDISGSLKPDLASLTLSSQNFLETASMNSPQMVKDLFQKMISKEIFPEFEVFDTGMVNVLNESIKEFDYRKRPVVNLILGNYAGIQAGPLELGFLMERIPKNSVWSVGGIGKNLLPANALALSSGGGVRVGLFVSGCVNGWGWVSAPRERIGEIGERGSENEDQESGTRLVPCVHGYEFKTHPRANRSP